MSRLTLTLLLFTLPCLGSFQTDYLKALEMGQEKELPILMFFNGSDWSGLAMKMKNEIFSSSEFEEEIADQLICVEVDFPRHHKLSDQATMQNQRLLEEYGISQFPTLVLIDPTKREIARMGYMPEGAKQLANDFLNLLSLDRDLHVLADKIETLTSEELIRGYKTAVELQQNKEIANFLEVGARSIEPAFFLVEQYRMLIEGDKANTAEAEAIRDRLFKADPNNELGHLFTIALLDFQARSSLEKRLLPEEVIKPLEEYLASFGDQDKENIWQIEMMIAQVFLEQDEWRLALEHAQTAYNSAPIERQSEMEHSLRYIKDQANQTASIIVD